MMCNANCSWRYCRVHNFSIARWAASKFRRVHGVDVMYRDGAVWCRFVMFLHAARSQQRSTGRLLPYPQSCLRIDVAKTLVSDGRRLGASPRLCDHDGGSGVCLHLRDVYPRAGRTALRCRRRRQTGRGWPGRNHERNVRQSHRLPAKLRSIDRQFMTNELNECVDWKRSSGKQRRIKNQRWKAQITLTACFLQLSLYIHCHRGINERWHRVAVVLSSQKKTSGFSYFLQSSSAFSTPVISTLAPASRVFHSLVFHSCVFSVHEWINK